MFLSKIFSIFKKKKDNPDEDAPGTSSPAGATVPPSGTVGAAVGLSQPDQSVSPVSDQIAQAPLPDNSGGISSFGQDDTSSAVPEAPSVDSGSDSLGGVSSPGIASPPPTDGNSDQPAPDSTPAIPPAEETPTESPEAAPAAPETPDDSTPAGSTDDSSENIAV